MRYLLFSDIHRDIDACADLVKLSNDADIVIGAGDFCTMHRGLDRVFEVLSAIDKPTVLVPGNSETVQELSEASRGWDSAQVLHGSGTSIQGRSFYGLGGGVPVTPLGDWSWDFTEVEAARLLARCPRGAILVSHSPPRGVEASTSAGESVGSTAVMNCIREKTPTLVVCGHIHDCWTRIEQTGSTMVVNAGPAGILLEQSDGRE